MNKKYIIFKDDDVGKENEKLKKWIDIVIDNDAKGCIGLIGKYMSKDSVADFINSLKEDKIEVFCHGYSHGFFPFLINRVLFNYKQVLKVEFDRDFKSHDRSLKKYRELEKRYLKTRAIAFGPPGNIWNDQVPPALLENGFKLMFSWREIKNDIFKIPLTNNLKQDSLKNFIIEYDKNREDMVFTLQFHHANLSANHFEVMKEVIDFLINNENRIFINPSELFEIFKKDKSVL